MSHIGIDARMIFYTGIGRNVYNLCTRLPALDPANQYTLFIRPEDRAAMPALATNCTLVDTISTIYKLNEQTEHCRICKTPTSTCSTSRTSIFLSVTRAVWWSPSTTSSRLTSPANKD